MSVTNWFALEANENIWAKLEQSSVEDSQIYQENLKLVCLYGNRDITQKVVIEAIEEPIVKHHAKEEKTRVLIAKETK